MFEATTVALEEGRREAQIRNSQGEGPCPIPTLADVWLALQGGCQWAWLTAWAGTGNGQMISRNCSLESYGAEIRFQTVMQWSRKRFS